MPNTRSGFLTPNNQQPIGNYGQQRKSLWDRIGGALSGVGRGVGAVGGGITDMLAAAGGAYAPSDLELTKMQQIGLLGNTMRDMQYGPGAPTSPQAQPYLNQIRAGQTRSQLIDAINGLTDLTPQEKAVVLAMPANDQITFLQEKMQYKFAPTASNQAPSNVREWEYFSQLTPAQQDQFLTMKRANPFLNTGGSLLQVRPTDPTVPQAEIPITPGPFEDPTGRAEIERKVGDEEIETQRRIAENAARIAAETVSGQRDVGRMDDFVAERNVYNQQMWDLDNVIAKAQEILDHPGFDMAFGRSRYANVGGVFNIAGGTDVDGLITTLQDNIFMEMIGKMRAQSVTGGAVGQVSEKEGERFENMLGNFRREQSEKQARKNINGAIRQLRELKDLYGLSLRAEYPEIVETEPLVITDFQASNLAGKFIGLGLTPDLVSKLESGQSLSPAEASDLDDDTIDQIIAIMEAAQ